MWTLSIAVLFVAGYLSSIYSWPTIKLWINGAQTEIASLEARTKALKVVVSKW